MSVARGRSLALVTGAGTGIGRAAALALAARGHHVLAVGRRMEPLAALSASASGHIEGHSMDVGDPASISGLLSTTHGRLTVAVSSAGTFTRGSVIDLPPTDWDSQIRDNLTGAFHTMRAATTRMLGQEPIDGVRGHIFTMNSGAGVNPFPNGSAYAAAKHGLRGLVESLRGELTGQAIKLTDLVISATVESEMSAGRDVPKIPARTVAATIMACLDLEGTANWDRIDLAQVR